MKLRHFLVLALAVGATAIAVRAAGTTNILFVLTDDEGWPTLGCYGNKLVPTPLIDRRAVILRRAVVRVDSQAKARAMIFRSGYAEVLGCGCLVAKTEPSCVAAGARATSLGGHQ
jgi:Sulfatase